MNVLSSLTNRIFLASAVLVVASIGVAIYRVNAAVTSEAEADLASGLTEAASLVDEFSRTEFQDFVVKGELIADLPVLSGAASTNHPPTVQPIAREYQTMIGGDVLVVIGRDGQVLAEAGRLTLDPAAINTILAECKTSRDGTVFWPLADGLLHATAIPLEPNLGMLLIGVSLDRETALRMRRATNSEVLFVLGTRIVASSFDTDATAALSGLSGRHDVFTVPVGNDIYIGRAQPLGPAGDATIPVALVLRSRSDRLRFLSELRWQIAVTALGAVLIATIVGYLVARTVTRPLRALSGTMREMAATGDLARALPSLGRWDDEDVRLVAATFHQLTSALDRFQRESSLRDRLSSLGRLSTVVAHEIRNPLMIIKTTARGLRRHPAPDITAAADSIDEEVARLNRVVTGVLDFARPIAFELAPADLGDICRDAADAARAALAGSVIDVEIAGPAPLVTDAERIRSVVVNVLTNAHQATQAKKPPPAESDIQVTVTHGDDRSTVRVADHGAGIAPADLARVFEPFYTTTRGGSGLGLAIARNIIEGLGGTISVVSALDRGTTVTIELPDRPAAGGVRA